MSKITDYLNERLEGEVIDSDAARQLFSIDGSILSIMPSLVIHPRNVDDIRKVARFTWRLAERGQRLPLTARGNGTDETGAALSIGTILSLPTHMAQVMEFDLKQKMIRVKAGISLEALSQATATQGLQLPITGGKTRAMTIGGAIASDTPGRLFAKYGSMRDWTDRLEVVLANGEVIETGRISRRELEEKKGLQTLEGEIYRAVDALVDDNTELVQSLGNSNVLRGGGYALDLVKASNGTFDLTPLFVGSQGTLGVISQAIIHLNDLPREEGIVALALTEDVDAPELINRLLELKPEALEMVDGNSLRQVYEITGARPWKDITSGLPYALVFVEFDDRHPIKQLRRAAKIIESLGVNEAKIAYTPGDVDDIMRVYDSLSAITNYSSGGLSAIPAATNLSVPSERVFEATDAIRAALKRLHLRAGVWGNIAAGTITVRPLVNLANLSQRHELMLLFDSLTSIAHAAEGSLVGCGGGGRLLAPWLAREYDKQTAELFLRLRRIFDPYDTLNTGVKDGTTSLDAIERDMRQHYINELSMRYNLRG